MNDVTPNTDNNQIGLVNYAQKNLLIQIIHITKMHVVIKGGYKLKNEQNYT